MNRSVNDNGNPEASSKSINGNDIEKFKEDSRIEGIAKRLVEIFDAPNSWGFYCDVARKLPEKVIWNHVEHARRTDRVITSPGGLFNYLCRKSIYKLNKN